MPHKEAKILRGSVDYLKEFKLEMMHRSVFTTCLYKLVIVWFR